MFSKSLRKPIRSYPAKAGLEGTSGIAATSTPVAATPQVFYYLNDHLGTAQLLVDAAKTVVWQGDAQPFGQVTEAINQIDHRFRFPGQMVDPESGLYYNWHRFYDPTSGLYLSPDPIGLDGGMNLYGYVSNNPINAVDPWGLSSLVFNAKTGTLNVFSGNGDNLGSYSAANNAQRSSRGPWDEGTYDFSYWVPHAGDGPDDLYGSNGNFVFNVPGCSGCGVHAGREDSCDKANRCGVEFATNGCIRTTDFATNLLRFLYVNGDKPTTLKVIR